MKEKWWIVNLKKMGEREREIERRNIWIDWTKKNFVIYFLFLFCFVSFIRLVNDARFGFFLLSNTNNSMWPCTKIYYAIHKYTQQHTHIDSHRFAHSLLLSYPLHALNTKNTTKRTWVVFEIVLFTLFYTVKIHDPNSLKVKSTLFTQYLIICCLNIHK